MRHFLTSIVILLSYTDATAPSLFNTHRPQAIVPQTKEDKESWTYFLRHLPIVQAPVLDYRGRPVANQDKQAGVIPFDVGTADLQQCADALMRLRAEYLFSVNRFNEIGFHFVGGQYYAWSDYCKGLRPVPKGNDIQFVRGSTHEQSHESLRKYLDLVYMYASTISLARELKAADDFGIGAIVIHPGSPGHCFIIIDETMDNTGEKLYKLAEGYTPAQSMYVLRSLEDRNSAWYKLKKGKTIYTTSYTFDAYALKKFE